MLGIYVSNISPLRPQGNLVERCHKEIGNLLKIYNIELNKWDIYLPLIVFYYNTNGTQVLNGLTPFEAMYLRPPKSPLSFNTKDKLRRDWTEHFGNFADKIFVNLAKNHKARFNAQNVIKGDIPTVLKKNQRVLILKPQSKGKSQKLYRKWDGPYRVVKKTATNVYLLCNLMTGKRCKRNLDLIRVIPKEKIIIGPKTVPAVSSEIIEQTQNGAISDSASQKSDSEILEITSETKNLTNILDKNLENEPSTNPVENRGRIRRKPNYLADYNTD